MYARNHILIYFTSKTLGKFLKYLMAIQTYFHPSSSPGFALEAEVSRRTSSNLHFAWSCTGPICCHVCYPLAPGQVVSVIRDLWLPPNLARLRLLPCVLPLEPGQANCRPSSQVPPLDKESWLAPPAVGSKPSLTYKFPSLGIPSHRLAPESYLRIHSKTQPLCWLNSNHIHLLPNLADIPSNWNPRYQQI